MSPHEVRRFDEAHNYLPAGYLLDGPSGAWGDWWEAADPDTFQRQGGAARSAH